MENTPDLPAKKQSAPRSIVGKIVRCIGVLLLVATACLIGLCQYLFLQLNIVRQDCTWMTFMCDMGEIVYGNRQNCIVFQTAYSRFSDAEMARRGYTHKEHFVCLAQQSRLSQRCYLPHFINKQYEKYQAKQRGEEFYGDAEDCRDIEIKGDGEKQ